MKVQMRYAGWDLDFCSVLSYKFYITTFEKENCLAKDA